MQEIKEVLELLNSALYKLRSKIEEADKLTEEAKLGKMKQDERIVELDQKEKSLEAREIAVKGIESIVDFSNKAKALMKEAKDLSAGAQEKHAKLDAELKKLSDDRAKLEAEYQEKELANKKQAEALKKDRAELNAQVKEFKITKKVSEEMSK